MTDQIITRFPPSPTGPLHIGNVRTALFNFLFARQKGGKFMLRVEDTDKLRSKKEYEEEMRDGLRWLGLDHDGEVWHQSERSEIYKRYLDKLIQEDKAYISRESEGDPEGKPPASNGAGNKEVIRFRNPGQRVAFDDLVRGRVEFDTTELGDFIIAKNLNEPLYHLAVVVDDSEARVTHVIRGEDRISNTPRQILIQEAIGMPRPIYAHLPLILAPDRSKLSKRKHGESVSLVFYRKRGFLPQAIVNYLALLGWNPGTDQEIFTLEELIKEFDLNKIQKGGAIFDVKKLEWVNREHVRRLPEEEQQKLRMAEVADVPYMQTDPEIDISKINWKDTSKVETLEHLEKVKDLLDDPDAIMSYASEKGKGNVLWPLRFALTGEERSPDPFTLLKALSKETAIRRIERAIEILNRQ